MVGHTSAFFLFPAPAGPGFPYSPYSGRKSRARVRVLLDRADHCGQVDVQHVAARGRKAGAMCVERLQPLLASCSNALDWLRLSLAPQQRSAQDSCTAIVRNRRRAACGGRASIGAQRHICWAIAWAHHAATLRESACDREDALSLVEPYSSYPSRASRGTLVRGLGWEGDALSLLEPYSSYPSRASRGTLVQSQGGGGATLHTRPLLLLPE